MKVAIILSAMLACTIPAVATAGGSGEIGCERGSLGYDALVAGDNELAVRQIMASDTLAPNDPGRLINLARAYARTGKTSQAAELFRTAMVSPIDRDLILADGRVMSAKEAARLSLQQLESRVAAK